MSKAILIEKLVEKGMAKNHANSMIDNMTEAVTELLSEGKSITLVGFGTFSVKERAARTGRNPQTGEEMYIEASKYASFKAGKNLKDAVRKQIGR